MSLTKRIPGVLSLVAALVLAGGCDTLKVDNPNAPDSPRLLSDPATVRSIAVGAMRTWYNTTQYMDPDGALIVTARSHVASWNNWQIRVYTGCTSVAWSTYPNGTCGTTAGTYPRIEWQNDPAASARIQIEAYWYGYYSALSSANDVIKAIRVNNVFSDPAVETMAVLTQGLALSGIALNYDKGFIVAYTTPADSLTVLPFSTRTEMRDAALAKFDEAISLATANTFTVPGEFFDNAGPTYTSAKIAQIANTMAARTLVYFPRDAVENATVNWTKVLGYASKGISSGTSFDWVFRHDGCVNWCDYLKNWSNEVGTMRVHTRVAHLLDPTTQPDPWNAAAERQPAWGTTSFDKRLGDGTYGPVGVHTGTNPGVDSVTETPSATANAGTDFVWSYDKEIQPAARGAWHQSAIGQVRYIKMTDMDPNGSGNGLGDAPIVLAAENDLLWAEALIRGTPQDLTTAAAKINKTRNGRGGLANLTGGETTAQMLSALQYEQDVELLGSNVAPYYNQRRLDALEPLTPHEMPVPAKELGVLQQPIYTWGGANPANSNPSAPAPSVRALRTLQQMWPQAEQQMLLQARLGSRLRARQ